MGGRCYFYENAKSNRPIPAIFSRRNTQPLYIPQLGFSLWTFLKRKYTLKFELSNRSQTTLKVSQQFLISCLPYSDIVNGSKVLCISLTVDPLFISPLAIYVVIKFDSRWPSKSRQFWGILFREVHPTSMLYVFHLLRHHVFTVLNLFFVFSNFQPVYRRIDFFFPFKRNMRERTSVDR